MTQQVNYGTATPADTCSQQRIVFCRVNQPVETVATAAWEI
jgi:hypothetical protein